MKSVRDLFNSISDRWAMPQIYPCKHLIGKKTMARIVTFGQYTHLLLIWYYSTTTEKFYLVKKRRYKYKQSAIRYANNHVV
jgi:hypothetical protein